MADMRFLEADDEGPEFRQAEPFRHLAAQHAALATRSAFAGDDQYEGEAVVMGALEKARQCAMGANLRHAMEIKPRLDRVAAA